MANTNQTQTQQLDQRGLTHERRSAHYKPNIWSYDFVQSLTTKFSGKTYEDQVKKLKNKFMQYFSSVPESSKPCIVENIRKLGLANVFHKEIKLVLDSILFNINNNNIHGRFEEDDDDDILATIALQFRLLRHYGYDVSQDVLVDFIDDKVNLLLNKQTPNSKCNSRGILELLEASHLAVEGDEKLMMIKAKAFSYHGSHDQLPCHWKTMWFDVRQQIHAYEMEDNHNNILLELASLNFNIVQAIHLQDLKEMSRWWKSLGLIENIGFTRDRLVESFLWTVGVACESQYSVLRKCLTKVVLFVLVLDDAYDIYGSFQELQYFTKIVERWNYGDEDGEQLPDCLKLCFEALATTCHEIALDIISEKGWNYDIIIDFLKMAWADFCKALLQEAWWYKKHHIPSLQDYLKCAWITSSGSLLSLIAFLCTANGKSEDLKNKWENSQQLIYYTSLVIRLLNDQGTSDAEFERGDAYSSILCYMEEENVTEAIARKHIKEMIVNAWTKINMELLRSSSEQQAFVNLVVNAARVCHFIYQKGDGFSVQDGYTKNKIKLLLIQPIQL